MSSSTVFVTSATGTQGEAVARQLRKLGWTVHATVRDLNAPAAKHLADLGVKLTEGDWDNKDALKASIAGCQKLFLNMRPAFETGNMAHERVQARGILEIAKEAGVTQVIYSSGVSVNHIDELALLDPNGIPAQSMLSKKAIEEIVTSFGFQYWTILRGAFFMANFLEPKIMMYPGFRESNTWTTALTPESKVPLVDCEDIAKFAIAALQDPAKFHQKDVTIAGDLLTPAQIMEHLSSATGRQLKTAFYTEEEITTLGPINPFINGQMVSRQMSDFVDFTEIKSWGIQTNNFKEFLEREKKAVKETYP
ncbi:NAD dependent epimerase/dehydratase [Thozetella sp. PMI_491]|nr:NAD dependent epimerase/dehydratase [Thozetella sp. PMI_491]